MHTYHQQSHLGPQSEEMLAPLRAYVLQTFLTSRSGSGRTSRFSPIICGRDPSSLHTFHQNYITTHMIDQRKNPASRLSLFSFKQSPPGTPVSSCQMRFDGPLHVPMRHDSPGAHRALDSQSFAVPSAIRKQAGIAFTHSLQLSHGHQLMDTQVPSPRLEDLRPAKVCARCVGTTRLASTMESERCEGCKGVFKVIFCIIIIMIIILFYYICCRL